MAQQRSSCVDSEVNLASNEAGSCNQDLSPLTSRHDLARWHKAASRAGVTTPPGSITPPLQRHPGSGDS